MGIGRYVGTCGEYMKYTLFIVNVLLFVMGVAVMSVAIWLLVDQMHSTHITSDEDLYRGIVYVLCGAGAFVVLVSGLGCAGAIKEVKCLLGLYALIVFIIFVVMLVGGILGYVFREKVHDKIEEHMAASLKDYGKEMHTTSGWDWLQKKFHCCGVKSFEDWRPIQKKIPGSCCNEDQICDDNNSYKTGCLEATKKLVLENAAIIGGCGIGLACLTLMALIFSCCLIKMIGDD